MEFAFLCTIFNILCTTSVPRVIAELALEGDNLWQFSVGATGVSQDALKFEFLRRKESSGNSFSFNGSNEFLVNKCGCVVKVNTSFTHINCKSKNVKTTKNTMFCPKALKVFYEHDDAENQVWTTYTTDAPFFTFMSLLHVFLVTLATVLTCVAFCYSRATQTALGKMQTANSNRADQNTGLKTTAQQELVSYFKNDGEYDDSGPATSSTDAKLRKAKSFLHGEHTYEDVV